MTDRSIKAEDDELQPILEDQPSSSGQRSSDTALKRLYSRFPSLRNPLYQAAAKNLALILTWRALVERWRCIFLARDRANPGLYRA